MIERAILATLDLENDRADAQDAASELEELCRASRLIVAKSFIFRQPRPNATLYMGKGKAEQIRDTVKTEKANVVVLDCDLSPSQQRNLEEILGVKTIDRTQLILDIFALRARSTEGRLQVELAQLQYLLPRLGGEGIYLSRLGGGVGTRGPGEQKLEVDRRRLRERILRLERELKELQKRRSLAIEKKKEKDLPLIALVGYTNAGKSTLFNRLTSAGVIVKDQLFSTLDTTTRALKLPGNQQALLVDTVGFVRRLPHDLVEAFKATLEEAVHADVLLHVADASRSDLPEIREAVENVLEELGAGLSKKLLVLNKCDLVTGRSLDLPRNGESGIFKVSAKTGQGVDLLLQALAREFTGSRQSRAYFLPKKRYDLLPFLYEQGQVVARREEGEGCFIEVRLSEKDAHRIEKRLAGA